MKREMRFTAAEVESKVRSFLANRMLAIACVLSLLFWAVVIMGLVRIFQA